MTYRIKEIKQDGKSIFIPQCKTLWWWSDMVDYSDIVEVDLTGYVGYRPIGFKTLKECQEFIDSKRYEKDIIYHHVN